MEIAVVVGVIAFIMKAMDFVKYVANWQEGKNGAVTQVTAWLLGALGGALSFTQNFAQKIDISSVQVGKLSAAAQAFLGVLAASIGSVVYDQKKARDNNDSAATPRLLRLVSRTDAKKAA